MSAIEPVRGTRDFYPEEMAFRTWLADQIRSVSGQFGYQEYEGPLLERLELYAAKSGAELVEEQSYVFEDRGGERVTLRPELTPTLARMVAARIKAMPTPIRWWSFGPFWRYERPQKGRSREFFQWNIDLLGIDSPYADAEIVAVAASFFRSIGLGPGVVEILVNNRRLVEAQLADLGFEQSAFDTLFRLIDRRPKLSREAWMEYAGELGLEADAPARLEDLLNSERAWETSDELREFFQALDAFGLAEYARYEPSVIRGLDYYTGTVFEARDKGGEHRAILGGGRYDDLVSAMGGDPVPGVGFAMGDVVLQLVLEENDRYPSLRSNPALVLVATFSEDTRSAAMKFASHLREAGIAAEWYPEPDRLGKQFKYADRASIPFVAVIGPDEIEGQKVTLREMRSGEQKAIPQSEASVFLKERL